jgi:serine/threonine-protein kinase
MTPLASATAVMHNDLLDRLRRAALGEYEILAELGRGGMASVYLAHDLQLDRKVAIKVMLPSLLEGEGMAERFKLEARTAANLSHPHIIPIFAVRDTDLLVFFVMKFIEGRPLDTIIREVGKVPIPMAQTILSKVGEALGYAHRQGVVHRDIKPANLMIDVEGQPIVTDFGIAKVAEMSGLTMTGATIGTPTYMSPEQATASPITGASDQYSLGILAYQMLSGHLPFNGETMVSLLYQHCHEPPPPFLEERPDCPPELHAAVMRMLEKKPEDRFPNLEAAVECIGRVNLAFDDPIRTQLVGLAKQGGNRKILESVKTPRSPIPTRVKRSGGTPQSGAGATVVQTPAAPRSRAPLWAGVAVIAISLTGIGIWRPWDRTATPGASDVAIVPVGPAVNVASLSVDPATGSLDVNSSLQLGASVRDSSGQPVSMSVIWTSADPNVATVSPTGLVVARTPGTVSIRASAGGRESSTLLTVTMPSAPAPRPATVAATASVASIRVDEVPPLAVGGSVRLRAVPLDGRGMPITGAVRWTSADPSRATVSEDGLVTALSVGDAVLVVRSGESVRHSVTVQILARRAASVAVTGASAPLTVGGTVRLSASAVADDGRAVDTQINWRSADPRVASVDDGVVTGVGAGSTSIFASADGREGSAVIRVNAPEVASRPNPEPARAVPVDPRAGVTVAINTYARALESRQISEVRKIYPGIQPDQETQLAQALRSFEQLKVTFNIDAFDVRGQTATATLSGVYEFFSRENRRNERLPVNFVATLQNGADGWMIQQIRSAR